MSIFKLTLLELVIRSSLLLLQYPSNLIGYRLNKQLFQHINKLKIDDFDSRFINYVLFIKILIKVLVFFCFNDNDTWQFDSYSYDLTHFLKNNTHSEPKWVNLVFSSLVLTHLGSEASYSTRQHNNKLKFQIF